MFGIQNMEELESGQTDEIKLHDKNSLMIEKKVQEHIQNKMKLIS